MRFANYYYKKHFLLEKRRLILLLVRSRESATGSLQPNMSENRHGD